MRRQISCSGDIVKVTPTSKVVGDMALMMVSQGLSRKEIEDPDVEVAFPSSVVDLMRGNIGQPVGGFPEGAETEGAEGWTLIDRPSGVNPWSRWTSRPPDGTCRPS